MKLNYNYFLFKNVDITTVYTVYCNIARALPDFIACARYAIKNVLQRDNTIKM